jgi:hypothetical protein
MSKRKNLKENKLANSLTARIKKAVRGLYFISESDAEILSFEGKKAESVTKDVLLEQTGKTDNSVVEEKGFEEFFSKLTEIQDWFGDEEKESAAKFSDLKNLLQKELKDLKVFKVGQTEIDIYVVGLDARSILRGIKTQAVET